MAAIAGIPEIINDFNLYLSGNRLVGVTGEVALVEFSAMTETVSGLGVLGEYETSATGRYGAMEQVIPFRVTNKDFFDLIDTTKSVELTFRGAQQYTVQATGGIDYMPMRIVYRGRCKKVTPGTAKLGGPMEASISIDPTYVLIELDGKKKLELDKLNGVYKVNGVDLLQKVRSMT